jgi:hypothetical protein
MLCTHTDVPVICHTMDQVMTWRWPRHMDAASHATLHAVSPHCPLPGLVGLVVHGQD